MRFHNTSGPALELRYEHAFEVDAYDDPSGLPGGGKRSQLMAAADLIFHF